MLGGKRRTIAQLIEAACAFRGRPGNDQMLKPRYGQLQSLGHGEIVETAEFAREHIAAAAGKFEDVIQLARAEVGIDLVGDRADQLEREERNRKLDAVWQLHGDDVAALDADAPVKLGAAQDFIFKRAVGDAAAGIGEDFPLGMRRGGFAR